MPRACSLRPLAFLLIALIALHLPVGPSLAQRGERGTPITVTGELEVVHADDFERGRSETFYILRERATGEVFNLRFERTPPAGLLTGAVVTVRGFTAGVRRGFVPRGLEILVTEIAAGDESAIEAEPVPAVTLEERKAVVFLVSLLDAAVTDYYTVGQVADNMFTGARSVDGLYRETSFDQMAFPGDTDGDGVVDVFGPFTIDYYASGSCDYYGWAFATDSAATAAGVNLSLYQHRVYVLPRYNELTCRWAGLANVGCGTYCRSWIAEGESPMVYAHELGHNLAMAHAATDPENDGIKNAEYGDFSDPMGASRAWHRFNAAHADQMGWFDAFPGAVVTVVGSAVYDIDSLESDPMLAAGPQILKVWKPDTNEYYYLSFRQPIGYDDSLSLTYTRGVNIHRYIGSGYSRTYFIVSLTDGASFEDFSNGLTVTQLGRALDGSSVTVDVALGGGDTTAPDPITDLSATLKRKSQVQLRWSAAWDSGSGVAEYVAYRCSGTCASQLDFGQIGRTSNTSLWDKATSSGTTYAYYVTAVDGVGNESDLSNQVAVAIGGSTGGDGGGGGGSSCPPGNPNHPKCK